MTDERGGRYFREARFFLAGDKVVAQSHILEARTVLGQLRDRHALGGPEVQVQYTTLDDGTKIKAVRSNGQYQAYILSPGRLGKKRKVGCVPFLSGLLNPVRSAWYEREVSDVETEPYIGVEWLKPSEFQEAQDPDPLVGYTDVDGWFAVPLYDTGNEPDIIYPLDTEIHTYGAAPATLRLVYASSYSGEMRKVVQMLIGMGTKLIHGADIVGETGVPVYAHGYYGTVGIVRAVVEPQDGEENPAPVFWLVRFPVGGFGMLAMPFPVCSAVTEDQLAAGIEYLPNPGTNFPNDIAEALADGSVIELMPAATFDSLVGDYMPAYTDCGWAFSGSGHEAQNVLFQVRDVSSNDTALFTVFTKRIKFTFAATEDTIECTGEVVEVGHVHTFEPGAAPRFPDTAGGLISFVEIGYPTITDTTSGPVHVYYVGDAEQVWSLSASVVNEPTSVNNPLPNVAIPCVGVYEMSTWEPGRKDVTYNLNGVPVVSATTGIKSGNYYETYIGAPTASPPYIVAFGGIVLGMEPVTIWRRSWTEVSSSLTSRPTMFVPPYQREGVNILDYTIRSVPGHTRQHEYLGVPGTGEGWEVREAPPDSDYYEIVNYYPSYWYGLSTCTSDHGVDGVYAGGAGRSGVAGSVTDLPGVVRPLVYNYIETLSTESTVLANIKFYGAQNVTVQSLSADAAARVYQVTPIGDYKQRIYSYTDAFDGGKYALSGIDPSTGGDFVSIPYTIADKHSVVFNFVGLA